MSGYRLGYFLWQETRPFFYKLGEKLCSDADDNHVSHHILFKRKQGNADALDN